MSEICGYLLYSEKLNRFYTGATQSSIEERIQHQNQQTCGSHRYTAKAEDWVLILKLKVSDYAHVVRLERKIKSMKSRIYIENLPKYPERQVKIIEETRKST